MAERKTITILTEELDRQDGITRLLLDSIFDGVYIVDRKRRILFWNRAAEDLTGYSAEEVTGLRCSDDVLNHIDEKGRQLCRGGCPLQQAMKTGQPGRLKVYPLHKSGRRFPVMTHVSPVRDPDGRVVGAIEVFRDISREEELRGLQEKFSDLIRRYVSGATLDSVLQQAQNGAASASRLRDVTVLFADLAGFTGYAETRSPDDIVGLLNAFYGLCEEVTLRFHGDIDKFIGDGVLAVFADADDAVGAAQTMLERFGDPAAFAWPLRVRIGVNSGSVVQGDLGGVRRKDVAIIGDVVNTAARVEPIADPGTLCITEATWSRLTDRSAFELHTTVRLKGRRQPVSVYRPRTP